MDKSRAAVIEEIAQRVMEDVIVEASEYVTVPGNSVENYVDGLIDNFVDTSDFADDEISYLKDLLIEASHKNIADNQA